MKKYKSSDGSYLVIEERSITNNWYIAWWIPSDGGLGAFVGDSLEFEDDATTEEERKERLEMETANAAAKPFSSFTGAYGYEFETEAKARKALAACTLALWSLDIPMPDWATKALEEGWKPPKGWKP